MYSVWKNGGSLYTPGDGRNFGTGFSELLLLQPDSESELKFEYFIVPQLTAQNCEVR